MPNRPDILIVGAGLTAATLAARLKHERRIAVVETRKHLGGNCYDYPSRGTMVHNYGPHIFHTKASRIVEFLSQYTEWNACEYTVTGEIDDAGTIKRVPFPYSQQTAAALGRELSPDEVLDLFFRGYTKKMWGVDWDDMPGSVRNRVPKDSKETSAYFPGQFQGQPRLGFTRMIENMLDGVDVILEAGPEDWYDIAAKQVVYCGRPDHIKGNDGDVIAAKHNLVLPYRSLRITRHVEDWPVDTVAINYCHTRTEQTRRVCYRILTGGDSRVVSHEVPYEAEDADTAPYYPKSDPVYRQRYHELVGHIKAERPGLILAGRMGAYMYYDMDQCVGHGLALADRIEAGNL